MFSGELPGQPGWAWTCLRWTIRAIDFLVWFALESGERREAQTLLAPVFSKQSGHDQAGPDGLRGGSLVTQGMGKGVWMTRCQAPRAVGSTGKRQWYRSTLQGRPLAGGPPASVPSLSRG